MSITLSVSISNLLVNLQSRVGRYLGKKPHTPSDARLSRLAVKESERRVRSRRGSVDGSSSRRCGVCAVSRQLWGTAPMRCKKVFESSSFVSR